VNRPARSIRRWRDSANGSASPVGIAPQGPSRPAARLSGFYAAAFLVTGAQLPFWPVWLAARGLGANEIAGIFAAAIWAKVIATPAIGALADRVGHRRMMGVLAATALTAYLGMWPAFGFWPLLGLNLVALTAQSALMPLGDTIALALSRTGRLEYGRVRVWGSVSFIFASLAGGAVLARSSGERVLPLVLGASSVLMLACRGIPSADVCQRPEAIGTIGSAGLRRLAGNPRFWGFVAAASALQASHQLYYAFGSLYWRSLGFSDATIGWLWAEGVLAEILLFWHGRRLLRRLGPAGLMALGGFAGVIRWGLAGLVVSLPAVAALQSLHALTFGASYLGAMHFLSRTVPPSAQASAQTVFTAASSGAGGGLVMAAAGALYAGWGGHAYLFMALLSAAGLGGALRLRHALPP
jgi:MFS transporter, PPP family, 3-phenylpropionic acid transporter